MLQLKFNRLKESESVLEFTFSKCVQQNVIVTNSHLWLSNTGISHLIISKSNSKYIYNYIVQQNVQKVNPAEHFLYLQH